MRKGIDMFKSTLIASIVGLGLMINMSQAQPVSFLGDDELFLIVKSQKAECMGVAPMECLQVKTSLDQADWQNFFSVINGFEFTEGESTLLKVKATHIDNPPADGSSIQYELIETVVVMPRDFDSK